MDLIPPHLIVVRYFTNEQVEVEVETLQASPLPELDREVEAFGAKVEGHLKRMGLSL